MTSGTSQALRTRIASVYFLRCPNWHRIKADVDNAVRLHNTPCPTCFMPLTIQPVRRSGANSLVAHS